MQACIGYVIPHMSIEKTLTCITRKHWKKYTKEIMVVVYGAMIYHTWKTRNWKVFRGTNVNIHFVYTQIQQEVRVRIDMLQYSRRAYRCSKLINKLCNKLDCWGPLFS